MGQSREMGQGSARRAGQVKARRWRWGVPHVELLIDRHGHHRWYYRRGKDARGPSLPQWGTAEFLPAWQAANAEAEDGARLAVLGAAGTKPGSLSAALVEYYGNSEWKDDLGPGTQKKRRQLLEKLRDEFGDAPMKSLGREHIDGLMRRLTPSAQRNWIKALRGLMKFCVAKNYIKADPTLGVSKAKMAKGDGFIAWTEDDLAKYRARWPLGTRQRLAVEIMVNLGLRRSDACRIGPADIQGGYLMDFVPQKTERSTGVKLTLPIRPELAAAIAAMKVVNTRTFMVGEARGRSGQPFKGGESFGAWMREQCDAAGLPDCSSHGLRKLAAIRLALAGCTVPELCKVFGWSSPAMAQVYVEQADQMRMADQAFARLDATAGGAKVSPTPSKRLGKTGKKSN